MRTVYSFPLLLFNVVSIGTYFNFNKRFPAPFLAKRPLKT